MENSNELKLDGVRIVQEKNLEQKRLVEENVRQEKRRRNINLKEEKRQNSKIMKALRQKVLIYVAAALIMFGAGAKANNDHHENLQTKGYEIAIEKDELKDIFEDYKEKKFDKYVDHFEGKTAFSHGGIASEIETEYELGLASRAMALEVDGTTARQSIDTVCRAKYGISYREFLDKHGFVPEGKDIFNIDDDSTYKKSVENFQDWCNQQMALKVTQDRDIGISIKDALKSQEENKKKNTSKGL